MEKDKIKLRHNDVLKINGYTIILENGEVKTFIGADGKPTDYVDVETAFQLLCKQITDIYNDM